MKIAIYPGSFDPITLGHLNIIERAAAMVDRLIVGVLQNQTKKPLFTAQERLEMIEEVTGHLPNVTAQLFDGLTIDFARRCERSRISSMNCSSPRRTGSWRRRLIRYF